MPETPGTAKTTAARILAGLFYEAGLLSSDELIETGRADLVGQYTGQTAPKVREIFRKAKGKLLFIDEAYALLDSTENSYGDEAINTIVQELENCREDTIVIFAGYPGKMDAFLSRNPGLKSRVPFRLDFNDYSAEELEKIIKQETEKQGFSISKAAEEKIKTLCNAIHAQPNNGNGRFCRTVAEQAILNYAYRNYGENCGRDAQRDFVLGPDDFDIPSLVPSSCGSENGSCERDSLPEYAAEWNSLWKSIRRFA